MEISFVAAPADDFDPEIYLRLLVAVCKSDPDNGPPEYRYVAGMARRLGRDIVPLWNETSKTYLIDGRPRVSRMTALLIIKDCIMLATLDGHFSLGEKERVYAWAERFDLPRADVARIEAWVEAYRRLRADWDEIAATA